MMAKLSDIMLFADDTSLIFKIVRKDKDDWNESLIVLSKWFAANNLLLNANKTKCLKCSLPNIPQVGLNLKLDRQRLFFVIFFFKIRSDFHNVNTRSKYEIMLPRFRLAKTSKSFLINSTRFYNKLPKSVTELTEGKFKKLFGISSFFFFVIIFCHGKKNDFDDFLIRPLKAPSLFNIL